MGKGKNFAYGLICCILAEVSYGMNGFGASRLRSCGFETHSILFYRFLLASAILASIIVARGESLRTPLRQAIPAVICGLCFAGSALTLYLSFTMMDSGLACTLLFVYPFMVIAIMAAFFKERLSWRTLLPAFVALLGLVLLSGGGGTATAKGVLFVMASALSYAGYMVIYEKWPANLGAFKMSLFTTVSCAAAVAAHALLTGIPLKMIDSPRAVGFALFLAVVPTVISIFFTVESLKHLGPTLTAILGALEPMTSIFMGVFFLGESFTMRLVVGSVLILSAVTFVAASPRDKH